MPFNIISIGALSVF